MPTERTAGSDAAREELGRIVEGVIHARTSSLLVDADVPVDDETLARLVRAAQAAPNHKTTRPLRVAILRGESRRALGEAVADAMAGRDDAPERVAKTRTKYLRAPAVMVVASAPGTSEHETAENDYAVAAGIQNMLLLAEALGLACLWSSPAKGAGPAIASICGFGPDDRTIGLVYVGWPSRVTEPKHRPDPPVHWLD